VVEVEGKKFNLMKLTLIKYAAHIKHSLWRYSVEHPRDAASFAPVVGDVITSK
jgi:hypothetical protein